MMDKNREAFEAAFKNWHPSKTGPYIKHIAEYFWNQSRQAIEVELPAQIEYDDPLSAYQAIKDCAGAITSLGIRVKGNEE